MVTSCWTSKYILWQNVINQNDLYQAVACYSTNTIMLLLEIHLGTAGLEQTDIGTAKIDERQLLRTLIYSKRCCYIESSQSVQYILSRYPYHCNKQWCKRVLEMFGHTFPQFTHHHHYIIVIIMIINFIVGTLIALLLLLLMLSLLPWMLLLSLLILMLSTTRHPHRHRHHPRHRHRHHCHFHYYHFYDYSVTIVIIISIIIIIIIATIFAIVIVIIFIIITGLSIDIFVNSPGPPSREFIKVPSIFWRVSPSRYIMNSQNLRSLLGAQLKSHKGYIECLGSWSPLIFLHLFLIIII